MPSQGQTFPVGSLATLPGWGSYDNLGPVPHFPTDLMFNDNMEIVGDDECAKMYEGRKISFCAIWLCAPAEVTRNRGLSRSKMQHCIWL